MNATAMSKPVELRAVLIAPDRALAREFCLTLPATRAFQIVADMQKYPTGQTLEIRLRQFQPEVVLMDVASDLDVACGLIRRLASLNPPVPVIGLDSANRSEAVMRVLRAGASEFLSAPFEPGVQRDAVAGLARSRRPVPVQDVPTGKVIAFASAKPGSGASTLACQMAFALRNLTRQRVLLADLDLAAGTVAFCSNRRHDRSFLDALEQGGRGQSAVWNSLTADCKGVDVLPAPAVPRELPLDPVRFRQVLDEARSLYAWTVLDLPAIFHRASLLALVSSDLTFLVSTAELPSLHLARRAVRLLAQTGITGDRFEVAINHTGRGEGMSDAELEKVLGRKVRISMPEDHCRLHEAEAMGEPVAAGSGLGEAIGKLAGRVAGAPMAEKRNADFFMGAGPVLAGA